MFIIGLQVLKVSFDWFSASIFWSEKPMGWFHGRSRIKLTLYLWKTFQTQHSTSFLCNECTLCQAFINCQTDKFYQRIQVVACTEQYMLFLGGYQDFSSYQWSTVNTSLNNTRCLEKLRPFSKLSFYQRNIWSIQIVLLMNRAQYFNLLITC